MPLFPSLPTSGGSSGRDTVFVSLEFWVRIKNQVFSSFVFLKVKEKALQVQEFYVNILVDGHHKMCFSDELEPELITLYWSKKLNSC